MVGLNGRRCLRCEGPIDEGAIAFCRRCAGGVLSGLVSKVGIKGVETMAENALKHVKADLEKHNPDDQQ